MAWWQFSRPKKDIILANKVDIYIYKSLHHNLQRGCYWEEEGAHVQYCITVGDAATPIAST